MYLVQLAAPCSEKVVLRVPRTYSVVCGVVLFAKMADTVHLRHSEVYYKTNPEGRNERWNEKSCSTF